MAVDVPPSLPPQQGSAQTIQSAASGSAYDLTFDGFTIRVVNDSVLGQEAAAGAVDDPDVGDVGGIRAGGVVGDGADEGADRGVAALGGLEALRYVVDELGQPPVVPAVARVLAQAVQELAEGLLEGVEVVGEGRLEHVVDGAQVGLIRQALTLAVDQAEARALLLFRGLRDRRVSWGGPHHRP